MSIDDYRATLFALSVVGVCAHDKLHTLYLSNYYLPCLSAIVLSSISHSLFSSDSAFCSRVSSSIGPTRTAPLDSPDSLLSDRTVIVRLHINTHYDIYVNTRLLSKVRKILFTRPATNSLYNTLLWIYDFSILFNSHGSTLFHRCVSERKKRKTLHIYANRVVTGMRLV